MIDRPAFEAMFDVPRGTMAKFDTYAALLIEWQQRMNLVGPSTINDIWGRHFADSAQLCALAPPEKVWLDLGAGAGFPGLVVALLDPRARLTLVEATAKKCRFLTEVSSALGLEQRVTIENRRIETLPRTRFDVITARALGVLAQLFDWGLPHAGSGTRWLLPKGVRATEELETATRVYCFDHTLVPSVTDPAARIIVATGVKRR